MSSDDLDGLREVRDQVTADVVAGEYGYDLVYFERMAAAQGLDCLQADVTRCGGITDWLRAWSGWGKPPGLGGPVPVIPFRYPYPRAVRVCTKGHLL